jgi:hypothetical protein
MSYGLCKKDKKATKYVIFLLNLVTDHKTSRSISRFFLDFLDTLKINFYAMGASTPVSQTGFTYLKFNHRPTRTMYCFFGNKTGPASLRSGATREAT